MPSFTTLTARLALLPRADIATAQVIRARFLKITDKEGLGKLLSHDWRYDATGAENPDFPLNRPERQGAEILLAGPNFGCGSSREHAPWALCAYGFRAVISTSFADIFRGNALKNGLLPVAIDAAAHAALSARAEAEPSLVATIDLATQELRVPGMRPVSFPIDSFSKKCLLEGVDELGYLLTREAHIAAFEAARGGI